MEMAGFGFGAFFITCFDGTVSSSLQYFQEFPAINETKGYVN